MTIDYAKLATLAGRTNDDQFKAQVESAIADLERQLGYPLAPTATAVERKFDWTTQYWHRVHPMYAAPTSVVLVSASPLGSASEETIDTAELQLGQNGKLYGDWFNMFRLCDECVRRCRLCGNCAYVKVTAQWGFSAPTGEGESQTYVLPSDLMNVLSEAVKDASNAKKDIQSEGTGTRNYSKFAASYQTVWQKYAGVIDFYRLKEQRFS